MTVVNPYQMNQKRACRDQQKTRAVILRRKNNICPVWRMADGFIGLSSHDCMILCFLPENT